MGSSASCFARGHVPAERVLAKYGEWEKPSELAARSSTLYFRSHHDTPVLKTRVGDLHEFGEGHTLYFFFLQSVSRLFFVVFLFSGLPSIVVSLIGDFYEKDGVDMDSATLGNLGHLRNLSSSISNFTTDLNSVENERAFVSVFRERSNDPLAEFVEGGEVTKQDSLIFISILDGFAYAAVFPQGAVFFFVGVLILDRIQNRLSADVDSNTVTVADYSIRVENLPADTTNHELNEFFSQWGSVRSTELVRTDCELIERARIDKAVAENVRTAIARAAKQATERPKGKISPVPLVRIKLQEVRQKKADRYTNQLYEDRRSAKAVCAFVTMERARDRISLVNAYPNSFGRRLFMRRDRRFRGKHRLKALPAPQPADIIWENLQFGFFNRRFRGMVTTVVKYTTLLAGFFFINIATSLRHNNPAIMDQEQCDDQCGYFTADNELSLSEELKGTYKSCYKASSSECSTLESSCYQCYCENAVIKGLDRDESGYCSKYLADFATATAAEVVAVLGTVFVNLSLVAVAARLSRSERHPTRIREESSTAAAIFLFQFINTAISTLVATTHIPRLSNLVKGTSFEERLFVGVYVDTTPNWYREVGRSLTITMIVQSGSRIVRVLARWLIYNLKYCCRGKALTQAQMNQAYMGPEFTLALRYGELLNLIFVTMFFGGGIPLLYLVTAISFKLQFMVEKAELLRLSQRPTSFGPDLAKMVGKLLPYATLWHCGFSAWAFSFQRASRSPLVTKSSEKWLEWIEIAFGYVAAKEDAKGQAHLFGERLMQVTAAHHVVLFFVIALFLLAKVTMSIWIKAVKKLFSFLGIIKDTGLLHSESHRLPDISEAISSGLLIGPTSYSLKSNPKYLSTLPTKTWATDEVESQSPIGAHVEPGHLTPQTSRSSESETEPESEDESASEAEPEPETESDSHSEPPV